MIYRYIFYNIRITDGHIIIIYIIHIYIYKHIYIYNNLICFLVITGSKSLFISCKQNFCLFKIFYPLKMIWDDDPEITRHFTSCWWREIINLHLEMKGLNKLQSWLLLTSVLKVSKLPSWLFEIWSDLLRFLFAHQQLKIKNKSNLPHPH